MLSHDQEALSASSTRGRDAALAHPDAREALIRVRICQSRVAGITSHMTLVEPHYAIRPEPPNRNRMP